MKPASNLLRWTSLALLSLGAAAAALAFTFILNSHTGLPGKWPAGTIPLTIRLGDVANLEDGSSFNTSARSATQDWNAVIGSAQFQVTLAPPTGVAAQQNGVNEVVFANQAYGQSFPPGVAGVTIRNGTGNLATEADITLNSDFSWDSYRGALRQTVDVRRVVLHELGHALGLAHPDQVGQSVNAIMNSRAGPVEALQSDDITGAQSLYGPPGPPANDLFANAPVITLNSDNRAVLNGFNTNATKETGEPDHAVNSGPSQTPNQGGRSVWWRWTAPATGNVTIDTKGSYYDTTLGIYTGSSVSSLTPAASSDDIEAGVIQASLVNFNVTAGTIYRIAVDGFNNNDGHGADSGGITLNVAYDTASLTVPTIISQPASVVVVSGSNATFAVTATGGNPLSYQWFFNGEPLAGAITAFLTITRPGAAQEGTYTVKITNTVGTVTSTGATLTLTNPTPPAPSPSGGGGGSAGGAPSLWFCAVLVVLGVVRIRRRSRKDAVHADGGLCSR